MEHDEYEMQIEYSEMTSFNFNSEEYIELKKDYLECEKAAKGFVWFIKNLFAKTKIATAS